METLTICHDKAIKLSKLSSSARATVSCHQSIVSDAETYIRVSSSSFERRSTRLIDNLESLEGVIRCFSLATRFSNSTVDVSSRWISHDSRRT